MAMVVKICGLDSAEAMDAALESGADMVGIMRFRPSPRHVDAETAGKLADRARDRAGIVLVTVDMNDDELDGTVEKIRPDYIQFHGRETPQQIAEIAKRTGCGAIKAIGVATSDDLAMAERYVAVCDYLILDAKPPKDATRPGGHGTAFDWSLLGGAPAFPYLLSGGLTPDNVEAALGATNAPGVDVSSGVESAPGVKDPDLIRRFVANARMVSKNKAANKNEMSVAS